MRLSLQRASLVFFLFVTAAANGEPRHETRRKNAGQIEAQRHASSLLVAYRIVEGHAVSGSDGEQRPGGVQGQRRGGRRRMQLENGAGLESGLQRLRPAAHGQLVVALPHEIVAIRHDVDRRDLCVRRRWTPERERELSSIGSDRLRKKNNNGPFRE